MGHFYCFRNDHPPPNQRPPPDKEEVLSTINVSLVTAKEMYTRIAHTSIEEWDLHMTNSTTPQIKGDPIMISTSHV